jgi:antitoxin component of MazEF toxin-antitoxin module
VRKRLTVIGNSLGLIIERPILELLGIDRRTEIEVSTDGRRLIIEPVLADRRAPPRRPGARSPDGRGPRRRPS